MKSDCLFCKIAKKEIKSDLIFESKDIVAFRDINPQAPVHVLVIPKKHLSSLSAAEKEDAKLLSELMLVARDLSIAENIDRLGYRIVINNGSDAGQEVEHLHIHLLGGRAMNWPPG